MAAPASAWLAPSLVGVLATVGSGVGYWNPSLWTDEAATISVASRPVPQIFAVVGHLDAVHAAYYLFMHVWISVLGIAPWSLRLPSVAAIGFAAAGVVVLGRQVATPRLGVTAGLLFAILPRVTWAATEARSFALVTMLAVWVTVVFMLAVRGRTTWWILYALLAAIGVLLFVYFALVVLAHGIALIGRWTRARKRPNAVFWWLAASCSAAALTLPFVLVAARQVDHIHHTRPRLRGLPTQVGILQWFHGGPVSGHGPRLSAYFDPPLNWAIGATSLAALSLVLMGVGIVRATPSDANGRPSLVEITLPWLLVPTLVVVAFSRVSSPVYTPRYMIVSAPAVALLVAAGLLSLRHRTLIAVAVAAMVLFAAPDYVHQRTGTAKSHSDWKYAAAVIDWRAEPGDVVVFGKLADKEKQTTRKMAIAYPNAFDGLRDITLRRSAVERQALWPSTRPLDAVTGDIHDARRVWLVSDSAAGHRWQQRRTSNLQLLESAGYRLVWSWSGPYTRIDELRQSVG